MQRDYLKQVITKIRIYKTKSTSCTNMIKKKHEQCSLIKPLHAETVQDLRVYLGSPACTAITFNVLDHIRIICLCSCY